MIKWVFNYLLSFLFRYFEFFLGSMNRLKNSRMFFVGFQSLTLYLSTLILLNWINLSHSMQSTDLITPLIIFIPIIYILNLFGIKFSPKQHYNLYDEKDNKYCENDDAYN